MTHLYVFVICAMIVGSSRPAFVGVMYKRETAGSIWYPPARANFPISSLADEASDRQRCRWGQRNHRMATHMEVNLGGWTVKDW